MTKPSDFKGIDQDLKRGIEYNRKHGGSPLKKIMRRPDKDSRGNYLSGARLNIDEEKYSENYKKIDWSKKPDPSKKYNSWWIETKNV